MGKAEEIKGLMREHPAGWAAGIAILGLAGAAATGAAIGVARRYKRARSEMREEDARILARIINEIDVEGRADVTLLRSIRSALRGRHYMSPQDMESWHERIDVLKARLASREVEIPSSEHVARTLIDGRGNVIGSVHDSLIIRNFARTFAEMEPAESAAALSSFGYRDGGAAEASDALMQLFLIMKKQLIRNAYQMTPGYTVQKPTDRHRKAIEAQMVTGRPMDQASTYGFNEMLAIVAGGGTVAGYMHFQHRTPDSDVSSNASGVSGAVFMPPVIQNGDPCLAMRMYLGAVEYCNTGDHTGFLATNESAPSPMAELFSQGSPVIIPNFFDEHNGACVSKLDQSN